MTTAPLAFELLGYFEEFIDVETHKLLGIRFLEAPGRQLGSDGMLEYTLPEPLDLLKGYKRTPVTVPAGRKVWAMVQPLCGWRLKE